MRLGRFRGLFLFFLGAFAALPVVFSALSFLAFFSFIPFCYLLFSELTEVDLPRRARAYYGTGLLFSMGYFMVVFHWFTYLYPLDFVGGMTPFAAILIVLLACIGLPFLQSLGYSFLFWGMAHLSRTRLVRRVPLFLPFLFAAGWTVFAYTQTLTWAGVPFGAQLALSQYRNLWFLSSASFFGSYFVTFVIALLSALLAFALLRFRDGERRRALSLSLLAVLVFSGNVGLSLLSSALPYEKEKTVPVAVLQGNFASAEKWSTEGESAITVYTRLAMNAAKDGARVIVWPETAITTDLGDGSYFRLMIQKLAIETEAYQVVGAFSYDERDGKTVRQNSLYLFHPDGTVSETLYHKRRLVPFGEFVPMRGFVETLFPPLANMEMLSDGKMLVPGEDPALFETPYGALGGLICFDTIYEDLARSSAAAGAELLVVGTNDSWFFDSAAVYMHNAQAVLRAVENRRAVIRAANTGISSIINEKGEVIEEIEPLIRGYATAEVSTVSGKTLYTQIGNIFVLLAQLFLFVPFLWDLAVLLRLRYQKEK